MIIWRIHRALCAVLLAALVFIPFVQVVLRDVFVAPIIGAGELTRFLLICTVFLAYPLVVANGENIEMTDLKAALPRRLALVLSKASLGISLLVCLVMTVALVRTVGDNLNNATPTLKIPFWLFLGATSICFGAGALLHAAQLFRPAGAHKKNFTEEQS